MLAVSFARVPPCRSHRAPVPARAGALACALATSACGLPSSWPPPVDPAPRPAPASGDDAITDSRAPGIALGGDHTFAVRILSGSVACTGALIADDQVLTAHHCVAGRSYSGEILTSDVNPDSIVVEVGDDYLPWAEIGVRAIVAPSCGFEAGDGDVAILVLERSLRGVATRGADLDALPAVGDEVVPLGFGRCAGSDDAIRLRRRAGEPIERMLDRRYQLKAAICPGDSGGPALDAETGLIVGVLSSSVMDGDEATLGLTEITRLDRFRDVFAAAARVAEGVSLAELPPLECR